MTTDSIRLVDGSGRRFTELPVVIEIRPARIGWRVVLTVDGLTGEERWWLLRRARARATADALIGRWVRHGFTPDAAQEDHRG
jgi:hypothetical protein